MQEVEFNSYTDTIEVLTNIVHNVYTKVLSGGFGSHRTGPRSPNTPTLRSPWPNARTHTKYVIHMFLKPPTSLNQQREMNSSCSTSLDAATALELPTPLRQKNHKTTTNQIYSSATMAGVAENTRSKAKEIACVTIIYPALRLKTSREVTDSKAGLRTLIKRNSSPLQRPDQELICILSR